MECLFNGQSNNCCAFCKYHNCAVTVKQMRAKQCLQKECRHLIKNATHSYWKQREAVRQKRKSRKEAMNEYISNIYGGIRV